MNVAEDIENTCLVTMDTVWIGRPETGKRRGQACISRPFMAVK